MRTTIHNAIKARRAERGEEAEGGFSLIELIIVVVILGILVAVAIPLVGTLQHSALVNSTKAAAANGATQAAAQIANGVAPTVATNAEFSFVVAGTTTDTLCVTATSVSDNTITAKSGPGC